MKLDIVNLKQEIDNKIIFFDINFSVNGSEIVGLIGRNGIGKTTLFKTIMGIYKPTNGNVYFDDLLIYENPKILNNIIYVPDRFDYFNGFKLKKVINFYKSAYDRFDIEKFSSLLNRVKLNVNFDTNMSSLSKGESAILSMILAKSTNAETFLIDEPFDGIDVINKKKMINILFDDEKCQYVISSHRLEELQKISDKVVYINENGGNTIIDTKNESKFHKLQIVFKKNLPDVIKNNSKFKIVNIIGRVAVVVAEGNIEEIKEYINCEDVIQYDFINVNLEDVFILKDKEIYPNE